MFYGVATGSEYQWAIGSAPVLDLNGNGLEWYSPSGSTLAVSAPGSSFANYQMTWPTGPGGTGQCLTSSGGGAAPMSWSNCGSPDFEFLVSHYGSIQAAINAAYNNGAVLGTVIDDRTAPYTGAGFNIPDSVIVRLAATTYTINSTTTFNNGNNNVTAGIIVQPGARLLGAGPRRTTVRFFSRRTG